MKNRLSIALTALAISIGSNPANSHGIWIAEHAGKSAIVYGHGAASDGYNTDKLKTFAGYDVAGAPLEITAIDLDDHVAFAKDSKIALVTAVLDNGHWTKDISGKWHNLPRNEVKDAESAGHYLKYTKAIFHEDANTLKPVGQPLEIIMLTNPLTLKAGDKLPVQVLMNGEPAPGAKLIAEYTTDSENSVKTDENGEAIITIRNNGLNVIAATLDETLTDNPKADKIGHFATFSFAYGHSH